MYWRDVEDLLAELPAAWSLQDENTARLIDLMDYWLHSEYASWTTDPDDPEVKEERDRKKALGLKPPPVPLLRPVALRPNDVHEVRQQLYQALVEKYQDSPGREPTVAEVLRRLPGEATG